MTYVHRPARHGSSAAVFLTVLATVGAVLWAAPGAVADPDEGGSTALDEAIGAYNDAKDELEASRERQDDLAETVEDSKEKVAELRVQVGEIAGGMYQSADLSPATAFFAAESPEDTIDALMLVSFLGENAAERIGELASAEDDLKAQLALLEDEIADQEDLVAEMDEARAAAARELAAHGGDATTGPTTSEAPAPRPVSRNPDGSLPGQGCTESDPTNPSGCLTPRTLHDLEQTEIAGWRRYTHCFRQASSGEHPIGRACDFSVTPGGFSGEAYGEAKAYGDNLAGWFVENSDALAVQYVIWYRKIWLPGQGWRTYDGAGGEPNSDHTNHVHLSVR